jgi:hypothetical protein
VKVIAEHIETNCALLRTPLPHVPASPVLVGLSSDNPTLADRSRLYVYLMSIKAFCLMENNGENLREMSELAKLVKLPPGRELGKKRGCRGAHPYWVVIESQGLY